MEEIYAELADGRIDGLILYTYPDAPIVAHLMASTLPVVALVDALPGVPSVVADDSGGSRLLAAHLAQQGHRHILYVAGPSNLVSTVRRLRGFQKAAQTHGLEVRECHPSGHHEQPTEADLDWLTCSEKDRPTAAVCWNDQTGYNLLDYCQRHGLCVPQDRPSSALTACVWRIRRIGG